MPEKAVGYDITYKTDDGVEITLTPEIVRSYLISGEAASATAQEIMRFMELCRHQRLNPFLREAYLIKPEGKPASILAGKDAFTKRAQRNEHFHGYTAGVVVQSATNESTERVGSLVLPNETLVGGWAKVFRKDWTVPAEITVGLSEYKRGTPIWASKPATMIRKVALVQALREAFPELSGMYAAEELDTGGLDTISAPAPVTAPAPTVTGYPREGYKNKLLATAPAPVVAAPAPTPTAVATPPAQPDDVFVFLERHEKVSPKGTPYNELQLVATSGEQVTVISETPAVIATAGEAQRGQHVSVIFAPKGRSKLAIASGLEIISPSNAC